MSLLQVLPCSKRYVHDWTVCPFAHPGEKAKRRDPRVFTYTGVACPDMKKVRRRPSSERAEKTVRHSTSAPDPRRAASLVCIDIWQLIAYSVAAIGASMLGGLIKLLTFVRMPSQCQRGDACPYAHNVFEYWMHPSR